MKKKLIKLGTILLIAALGYALGRYVQPEKVITQVKEVEVEKVRTEYKTVVKTINRPDGTKETEETKEIVKDTENSSVKDKKQEILNKAPEWKAGIMIGANSLNVLNDTTYGLQVERRILGPIFGGIWGTSSLKQKTLGASISMEF